MTHAIRIAASAWALVAALPAAAQADVTAGVELATDENRRGLSWSAGRVAPSADIAATLGAWEASGRIVALRGSPRHAGADMVADLQLAGAWELGPVRLRGRGIAHVFAGARGRQDYVEVGGDATYAIGPLQIDGGVLVAPAQRAVGGTNVYVFAGAAAGLPGTPVTLSAGIGHTTGGSGARADRLRPGGAYTDWRLGAEFNRARLTLALDYVGTDIGSGSAILPVGDPVHAGDRIVARARLAL